GGWYAFYWKVRWPFTLAAALVGMIGSIGWMMALRRPMENLANEFRHVGSEGAAPVQVLACTVAFMLGLGIVVKCFRAVVMGRMTEHERAVNMRGLRAWLSPMSVVSLVGFAVGMSVAVGWSLWWVLMPLAMLTAYPLIRMALHDERAAEKEEDAEDLTEERNRVLTLVETGKISGEDAAELIAALGQSRVAKESGKMSVGRKVMLLGGLLVVVGLCLPWFKVDLNLGQAVHVGIPSSVQGWAPRAQTLTVRKAPGTPREETWWYATVRAGDVRAELGWIIVGLGMVVATLPLVWAVDARSRRVHRGISVAAMGAGSVLLLYVVSGVMSAGQGVTMQAGMFLMMAGYAVVWVGVVREYLKVSIGGGKRRELAII
ncbi:MAG: hypothetical protein FWD53_06455, partial [Phycisphaerales bacterium]|nr:hypothetical protein [Phycisphaerales bacterium]